MTWTVCGSPPWRGPCRRVCPTCTTVSHLSRRWPHNDRPTVRIETGGVRFSCARCSSLHGVRAICSDPQVRRSTALRIELRAASSFRAPMEGTLQLSGADYMIGRPFTSVVGGCACEKVGPASAVGMSAGPQVNVSVSRIVDDRWPYQPHQCFCETADGMHDPT